VVRDHRREIERCSTEFHIFRIGEV
jgi:hypothetical protein